MIKSFHPVSPVDPEEYQRLLPDLRLQLVQAQQNLQQAGASVLIVIDGVEGAGRGAVIQQLNEWMDPRGLTTEAFWNLPSSFEERPEFWRYWVSLPKKGDIGIFFGAWYGQLLRSIIKDDANKNKVERAQQRILQFERMISLERVTIVKIWLHLSKKAQKKRLEHIRENPRTHWRTFKLDPDSETAYDDYIEAADKVMLSTHTEQAPWVIVDSSDPKSQNLNVAKLLLEGLARAIEGEPTVSQSEAMEPLTKYKLRDSEPALSHLHNLADSELPSPRQSKNQLKSLQAEFNDLTWKAFKRGISTVAAFEGWDAAGKGGCIRRLTKSIDARLYKIISTGPPNDQENAFPYLWRFWKPLPQAGHVVIFDRSWYGRLLVERIEGFATENEWRRAFDEINEFEAQLVENGIVVLKYWLHITKDVQLERFRSREAIPYKRYKITNDDWRNRKKWDAYQVAVEEMVKKTNTKAAPWAIIPANEKKYARVLVVEEACRRLAEALA